MQMTLRLVDEEEEGRMLSVATESAQPATAVEKDRDRDDDRGIDRYEHAATKPTPTYPLERTVIRTERVSAGS